MEDKKYQENLGIFEKLGVYVALLLVWFLLGGFISWTPLLSDGIIRFAGELVFLTSLISWGTFSITIAFVVFNKNATTLKLLIVNIIIWFGSSGWVWYKLWE